MRSLLIILIAFCSILIKAQAPTDSVAGLLLQKEYTIWQNPGNDTVFVSTVTEKAVIYRQNGNYKNASSELERAVTRTNAPAPLVARWKFERLTNYYLAGEFQKANALLESFEYADASSIHKHKEYLYMRWGTSLELHEWKKCKNELLTYADSLSSKIKEEVANLPDTISLKIPTKARRMSAFLPGLGSMYAGYPLKGTASLLINGAFAGGTALLVVNQLYITAAVTGFLPLSKLYRGNIKLSEQLTHRKNDLFELKLKQRYYKTLLELLNHPKNL